MSKQPDDEWIVCLEVINPAIAPEFCVVGIGYPEGIGDINRVYNQLLARFTDDIPQLDTAQFGLFRCEFTARDGRLLRAQMYLDRVPF